MNSAAFPDKAWDKVQPFQTVLSLVQLLTAHHIRQDLQQLNNLEVAEFYVIVEQ